MLGLVKEILSNFGEGGGPRVCKVLGVATCFCRNVVVFSTDSEEIVSNFGQGGSPGICKPLALVNNGVVLSMEGILSNFGEGGCPRVCERGGHGVCGVGLLSFAAMK